MSYEIQDDGTCLKVRWDSRPVLDYTYASDRPQSEGPKPRLRLFSPGGDLLVNDRPHDHPWHHGLAFTLTELSGNNFWGGPTFTKEKGYQDRDNQGKQAHQAWIGKPEGGQTLKIAHTLKWVTFQGELLLEEERTLSALAPENGSTWLLNFDTVLKNVSGRELEIGSPTTQGREMAGYMGLMWRGPRSFLGGKVISPDGPEPKDPMGKRCPWLAYVGAHDGSLKHSTFAFADDARNPRFPTEWFVRTDPFAIMSCAFAFSKILPFPAASSLPLHYRILAADGALDAAQIAKALA